MFLQRLFRRKAALVRSASSASNSRPSSVVSRQDLDERDVDNLLDDMMAFSAIGFKRSTTPTPTASATATSSTPSPSTTTTASSSPQI